MCGNCWPETGDQSIYFSHVCRETTYKLRPQLSCSSSQVWPARISGVIESVFRCSGPNSKSIVTLTRPVQRKNAPPPFLSLLPPFLGVAATGDFHIDYCPTTTKKSVQGAAHQDKCSSTQCQMCKVLESSEPSEQKVQRTSEFFLLLSLTVKSKQNRYKEKPYSEKGFICEMGFRWWQVLSLIHFNCRILKKEELDVYYYEQWTFTHNCNWFLLFGSAVLRLEGVLPI